MTLEGAVAAARVQIEGAGVSPEIAALDAEILARHVLGWDRARWVAERHHAATEDFVAAFRRLVARRGRREPVAYVRGVQEFWGRPFVVTSDVLIPRPETELIVEIAGGILEGSSDASIADVGTGSGCLAITLALEHANRGVRVFATDISPKALDVARINASRLGAHVDFRHGAYLADVPRPIDLIVSNPPYVAESERPSLAPEVIDYEPSLALFAGADGLDAIRPLLRHARAALRGGGHLLMEIGWSQGPLVEGEVAQVAGLTVVALARDLQGIQRVALIKRTTV